MYSLPVSISIEGKDFAIRDKGDFRMVIDCLDALQDVELTQQERIIAALIIFYEDINDLDDLDKFPDVQVAIDEMYKFFGCGEEVKKDVSPKPRLIDWKQDSMLVCSAINTLMQKEIRVEPYVHWWTFLGYYMSVGESTLATVVSIRDKIVRGKTLDKSEKEFKANNPDYFIWNHSTLEEQEADKLIREIWNNNSKEV